MALLVLHHGWLLLGRLRDASISEPAVALRWGLAALVLGLAALFQRRGLTVFSGRSGLAFWLLVLLLHVGVTPVPTVGLPSEKLLVALPLGIATALALALGAAHRAGRAGRAPRPRPSPRSRQQEPPVRPRPPLVALRFAPRPPPAV